MKILALSGSLRVASNNTLLLHAVARIAPEGVRVTVYPSLGDLPLFNPDIEFPHPPAVAVLREAISAADAIVIASPEYAHGVTGVMKNALDWMVGNESFVNKPVMILNASSRATHAHESLREILKMMSAKVIDAACITIPLLGSGMTADDIAQNSVMTASIVEALNCMRTKVDGLHRDAQI